MRVGVRGETACVKTSQEYLLPYLQDITLMPLFIAQRALRDDLAFKLTYYYGRNGVIHSNQVLGHQEALLQVGFTREGGFRVKRGPLTPDDDDDDDDE